MLKSFAIEPKVKAIYEALTSKGADPLSTSDKAVLSGSLELLSSTVEAIHSIAESLQTLAKAKRHDMGWKPGDEVQP